MSHSDFQSHQPTIPLNPRRYKIRTALSSHGLRSVWRIRTQYTHQHLRKLLRKSGHDILKLLRVFLMDRAGHVHQARADT